MVRRKPITSAFACICVLVTEASTVRAHDAPPVGANETVSAARSTSKPKRKEAHHSQGHTHPSSPPLKRDARKPSPEQAEAAKFAAFDKLLIKGWDFPHPSTADTIIGDWGGIRSALADYGIGFFGLQGALVTSNLSNNAPFNPQTYSGQKPTFWSTSFVDVVFDLEKVGLTGGTINTGAIVNERSFAPLTNPGLKLNNLYYHQTLFGGAVEFEAGLLANDFRYIGTLVAGNPAAGVLGPSASVQYQVGLSRTYYATPGADLLVKFPDTFFYNRFGVQRSIDPNGFEADHAANPTGFTFSIPRAKALFINEFGYDRSWGPNQAKLWLRTGGVYNTSSYFNYETLDRSDGNWMYYAAADIQLTQPSAALPFQGYYVGGTFMTSPQNVQVFPTYVEARAYAIGMFPSRPFDQTNFVFTYTGMSDPARGYYAALTGILPQAEMLSYAVNHTFKIDRGVNLSLGLNYAVHPSPLFRLKDALISQMFLTLYF